MTFGNNYFIRKANSDDITSLKVLVDQHRYQLGFVLKSALQTSIDRSELLVTVDQYNAVLGFVQYRHRKDGQTTLYNIVVAPAYQSTGIGKRLLDELINEAKNYGNRIIVLKCPVDLPSNRFYERFGFRLIRSEEGKKRALNIWSYNIYAANNL